MGFFNKIKKVFDSTVDERGNIDSQDNGDDGVNKVFDSSVDERGNIDSQDEWNVINGNVRNFKYLDDLIHSGIKEIILDSNIVLGNFEEFNYSEGIKLDVNDLVIDGNGYSIDAGEKTRIFKCNGKNITIKNIVLKNGSSDCGGAIYNGEGGELFIIDSKIYKNMALKFGSALSNSGKLTIFDSIFFENEFNAIYNDNELIIRESTIKCEVFNVGELTIEKSIFDDNKLRVSSNGYLINNMGSLTISKSAINNSTDKGVINNKGGKLFITESAINNNCAYQALINNIGGKLFITESAINNNTLIKNSARVILNNGGEINIYDSMLNENISKEFGGVIHNKKGNLKIIKCNISSSKYQNNIILNEDLLEIQNSNFKKIQSNNIIINTGNHSNLSIFHGEFVDNNVHEYIICNSGKFCSIERTIFKNNHSNINSQYIINKSELTLISPEIKDYGKRVLNEGYLLLKNSSEDFLSKIQGEGIVEVDINIIPKDEKFDFGFLDKKIRENTSKEISLDQDICLENYERDFYEGGIELCIDNLIIDGKGHSIDGQDKSRIFLITGQNITLKNITFKNGHSHKNYNNPLNNNGGAIKSNHDNNIKIENCKFINNVSEENGGAIENRGELDLNESAFKNNIAQNYGGAIYNESNINVVDSIFNNNKTKWGSGAIHNNCELSIFQSIFNNNSITNEGIIKLHDIQLDNDTINNYGSLLLKGKFSSNQLKTIVNSGYAILTENNIDNIKNLHTMFELKILENNQKDFTYLNKLISTGINEIKLENDIILNVNNNEDDLFNNGIKVDNDELIIDGNNHIIDAQCLTRIFYFTGKNIVIKNITLKNGFVNEDIGKRYDSKGELTIKEAIPTEDNTEWYGGAIIVKSRMS